MPTETNLNTRVTQLALDAAYYEAKQAEAWDLVAQLSNWVHEEPFELVFLRKGSPQTPYTFTFNVSAHDSIAAEIFTKLFFYYRTKHLGTSGLLASVKQESTPTL